MPEAIKPIDTAAALAAIQQAKEPAKDAPAHIFTTAAGLRVEMSAPKRATQLDIGAVLGDKWSSYSFNVVKALMYVTAVGGSPVGRICTRANADALMNKLGDAGVDEVLNAFMLHFQVRDGSALIVRDAFRQAVIDGHISQEQAEAAIGGPIAGETSNLPL